MIFCKGAAPGTRYWLNDELFERLWARMDEDLRYFVEPNPWKIAITYRGGYECGGLTFYRKSQFPNPPRRAPGRQNFYAR